ncbi:hypothetical protein MUA01_17565 [Enterobacteriaceae bacterium H18W14]|uniref:hypothetical protein n=1 Tax=Dryocola boscaweniae TaxID=2925397 RepID=UPI0022F0C009|nr:hypothetical protein [Dryocola boscaweniae]MCT4716767.1 hypothetical protein [Dryocola boscaweniae]
MSQNWLRHFELQLLRADGGGIKLSGFKAMFKVQWFSGAAPKVAELKIYNLAPDTANKIIDKEFSKIRLFAGYDGLTPVISESEVGVIHEISPDDPGLRGGRNYGLIFSGDIRITIDGRDSTPDTWLLVQAIDGHEALSYATISATLSKGYTVKDMYDLALAGLKPYNIVGGALPDFPTTIFPRGYTFHGKVSSYLSQIAKLCDASWELLDDRLEMYGKDHIAHPPVPLNSANGLTGMPQSTTGAGINATCLINPNIRLMGQVLLNESSIYQTAPDLNTLTGRSTSQGKSNKDGVYEVYGITYNGDTRGNDWYMNLMCRAKGSNDLPEENPQTKRPT